jgi:hypothetical protein
MTQTDIHRILDKAASQVGMTLHKVRDYHFVLECEDARQPFIADHEMPMDKIENIFVVAAYTMLRYRLQAQDRLSVLGNVTAFKDAKAELLTDHKEEAK